MEMNIAQRIKEVADQVLQLSADVAQMSQNISNEEDLDALRALSDRLFHEQSVMRYEDYWLVQDIFDE